MTLVEKRECWQARGQHMLSDPRVDLGDAKPRLCTRVHGQHPAQWTVDSRPQLRRGMLVRCRTPAGDLGVAIA